MSRKEGELPGNLLIFKKVYESLEFQQAKSITAIARETGISWETVRNYLKMMVEIQSSSRIVIAWTMGEGRRFKKKLGKPPEEEPWDHPKKEGGPE